MRVAVYARVSTADKGQDPETQLGELREYCKRRGWEIANVYVDIGVSGMKDSRPELDRMMADAKRRLIDAVVVYRYDRFSRSMRHLVNSLAEFQALGVEFVSVHEGVDTSTPHGKLVFGIFASMAEFERNLIRERVLSGIARARRQGKHMGRPSAAVDAGLVLRLHENGQTLRQIAKTVGVSRGVVHKVIQRANGIKVAVKAT